LCSAPPVWACGGDPSSPIADDGSGGSTGSDPGTSAEPDDDDAGPLDGTTHAGSTSGDSDGSGGESGEPPPAPIDLPYDPEQLAKVCRRGNADTISQVLCTDPPPQITSIVELYDLLQIGLIPAQIALTGNSAALAARSVSAVNPRVILQSIDELGVGTSVSFSRGDHVVEAVAYDAVADRLNFYVLRFYMACEDTEDGCSIHDRFSPATEADWTQWSLYQDIDLLNTPRDCLTCHQPKGPDSPRLLLMRQAEDTWMHWFPSISILGQQPTLSDDVLTPLFLQMHGGEERYAGVPLSVITPGGGAAGIVVQQLLEVYWGTVGGVPPGLTPAGQPDTFDSIAIEQEGLAGSTSTWDAYYADVLSGDRRPIPHYRHDITDPVKRDAVIASYQAVMSGAAAPETMLDPSDVLDEQTEAELSFRPRADASAEEMLHHICQRCHDDDLDQSLSRADFNAVRPDELTAAQKAAAIDRLLQPAWSELKMPPPMFATLSEAQIETLVDFLEQ
jgi:hypothetical protein